MMQLDLLDPFPAARRADPQTSHDAAEQAKELMARHHRVILATLQEHGPLGKDGIAARSGLTAYQVSKRLTELERQARIEPTGRIVKSIAGRGEREWRIWE